MTNTPSAWSWSPTLDSKNRLDAKNPNREGLMEENPYMQTMYDIRSKLRLALENNEVPDCPSVTSMDELLKESEKVVNTYWQKYASGVLEEHKTEWLKKIEGQEEYQELFDALSNSQGLEEQLSEFQISSLESLRSVAPEIWYELLLASSERQLAQVALLNYWLKQKKEELPKAVGMTPDEFKLVLDIGNLAKYFNMAYLKQTELADTPEGSSATPLATVPGSKFLYEVFEQSEAEENPETESHKTKTFGEVFKPEWIKIVEHFKRLSVKTATLVEQGKIPASYAGLSEHFNLLAQVYGSEEKDPKKLIVLWNSVDKSTKELAEKGCPISIIGQAVPMVAGEANKVDVELRVGLRDKEAQAYEEMTHSFHKTAQSIVEPKAAALHEKIEIPFPVVSRHIYSLGTDINMQTMADTRTESTNLHYDTITRIQSGLTPYVEKLFINDPLSEDDLSKAAVLGTSLHELAHGVLFLENEKVAERVGKSNEAWILEELKAETAGFLILRETMQKKEGINIEAQVRAKMADIIDYASCSSEEGDSTERYYYAGLAMLKELLEQGAVQEKDGRYEIGDPKRVIDVIADMGTGLLSEFYENENCNPETVKDRIGELRKLKSDPKIVAFLEKMQEAEKELQTA